MRCSTAPETSANCAEVASQMLIYSTPDTGGEPGAHTRRMEPVCEPCGQTYVRREYYRAMCVPLHVHMPESAFIEIIEGHRLVKDPEHEARCYDCGRTGSIPVFQVSMLHGCKGRPESVDHLSLPRDATMLDANGRAEKSARLWFQEATHFLGMAIGDWRPVTDDESTCATFTFNDREYRVIYDLLGYSIGAEKLPNRGRPQPEIIDGDLNPYNQAVFYFHDLVTDSGSAYFATWTPGHANIADRYRIILYTPEGAIREVLYVPGLRSWAETTGAICDAFGSISRIKLQTRIYE